MELEELLHKHFGYSSFRPGQREVIEAILQEKDVMALLPTGMGKSLCYQLPAYILEKPVLIVSPLLSLMQDQVEELKRFGEKRVVALNSFLSITEKRYVLHYLEQYRFIFYLARDATSAAGSRETSTGKIRFNRSGRGTLYIAMGL
ncbi:DEAD/DEAH box helicase [Lysinibacillus sp. MHQ-1]|nr:DEAD/DEAH box helicase [Lysinibacillus sp. MHQ-1]